eukprot:m.1397353 g.1397353  ORF g.1397353 m.1397353 type:complete len:98 (+) comp24997_c1_seq5:1516-1809(+)
MVETAVAIARRRSVDAAARHVDSICAAPMPRYDSILRPACSQRAVPTPSQSNGQAVHAREANLSRWSVLRRRMTFLSACDRRHAFRNSTTVFITEAG